MSSPASSWASEVVLERGPEVHEGDALGLPRVALMAPWTDGMTSWYYIWYCLPCVARGMRPGCVRS